MKPEAINSEIRNPNSKFSKILEPFLAKSLNLEIFDTYDFEKT
jgi:hypothetical protein